MTAKYRIRIFWGNPYTNPPEGMPRVLMSALADTSRRPFPPEIEEMLAQDECRPGSGWTVGCECIEQRPIRRWSQAARARVRKLNLRRRLERKFPLFAEIFIAAELAARPSYYEGSNDHRP